MIIKHITVKDLTGETYDNNIRKEVINDIERWLNDWDVWDNVSEDTKVNWKKRVGELFKW